MRRWQRLRRVAMSGWLTCCFGVWRGDRPAKQERWHRAEMVAAYFNRPAALLRLLRAGRART